MAIRSDILAWDAFRQRLEALPSIDVIGDVSTRALALELAQVRRPSLIFAGNIVEGESSIALLTEMRHILGPNAVIVLITEVFELEEVVTFASVQLDGYFLWRDLTPTTIHSCLELLATGRLAMSSRQPAIKYLEAVHNRTCLLAGLDHVTPRELRVLRQMAQGRELWEIAAAEQRSEHTIRRDVDSLYQKLGASDRFTLGVTSAMLGLVP